MRFLKRFESFGDDRRESDAKTMEFMARLSEREKSAIKADLERFARENGATMEDLSDPEKVKQILAGGKNESIGSWLKQNWYGLIEKISKYGRLFSAITFVGSLIGYYGFGLDTMTGVKAAAVAFIISSLAGALKGFKGI